MTLAHVGISFAAALAFVPTAAAAACGDRGGPGYRASDGKCVGWEELARKCGKPPEARCTAENVQPEADEAAKKGVKIQQFKDDAHERLKGSGR